MKITLVDDEPESIEAITSLLKIYLPEVDIIGAYTDPIEGLEAIKLNPPEVLLLDIEMPGITGLELLNRIPEIEFELIFITAFNQYAINAIKLSAIDYLLKPIDPDEFQKALERAKAKLETKNTFNQFQILLDLLQKKENQKKSQAQRIALPTKESLEFVKMENIVQVLADQNYCSFYLLEGGVIITSKNIGVYEKSLDEYDFMRVHRSHIVNLHLVKRYIKPDGGELEMEDGSKVPVSNSKKRNLN